MAVKINIDTLFIVNTECASKSTKQRVCELQSFQGFCGLQYKSEIKVKDNTF